MLQILVSKVLKICFFVIFNFFKLFEISRVETVESEGDWTVCGGSGERFAWSSITFKKGFDSSSTVRNTYFVNFVKIKWLQVKVKQI